MDAVERDSQRCTQGYGGRKTELEYTSNTCKIETRALPWITYGRPVSTSGFMKAIPIKIFQYSAYLFIFPLINVYTTWSYSLGRALSMRYKFFGKIIEVTLAPRMPYHMVGISFCESFWGTLVSNTLKVHSPITILLVKSFHVTGFVAWEKIKLCCESNFNIFCILVIFLKVCGRQLVIGWNGPRAFTYASKRSSNHILNVKAEIGPGKESGLSWDFIARKFQSLQH